MANYIAIIELHGAENEEDFQKLDAAMKERQFFPQILDDDGGPARSRINQVQNILRSRPVRQHSLIGR